MAVQEPEGAIADPGVSMRYSGDLSGGLREWPALLSAKASELRPASSYEGRALVAAPPRTRAAAGTIGEKGQIGE
jgi:hypothetical protein